MTTGQFYEEGKKERINLSRILCSLDLWSGFGTIVIGTAAAIQALPSITIAGVPSGVTLARAVAVVKFRVISEHLGSDASLQGDQQIQVRKATAGTWTTGLTLLNGQLICPLDAREFGDALIGNADIKDQIPANGETLEVQWVNSRVAAGEIHLEDLQTGVRIWYAIA